MRNGEKSSAKAITAATVGTLSDGNIIDVPATTKVSELKAGLTVSEKATVEILAGTGGEAVADQANTDVTSSMVIKVTAEDGTSTEYTIGVDLIKNLIIDSVAKNEGLSGNNPYQLMKIKYDRSITGLESVKLSIKDSEGKEYATGDYTSGVIGAGSFEWSYRDLKVAYREKNEIERNNIVEYRVKAGTG